MTTQFRTAAVIGAGQMGGGIAQVLAASGIATRLYDQQDGAVAKALTLVDSLLARQIEKQKLTAEQKDAIVANLKPAAALEELADVDIVIEAIVENPEAKAVLFRRLDGICSPATILASNTSSISITRLAATTKRPERFIGLHFMNPVPVMQLVEVIRGLQTSDVTYERCRALIEKLNKTPVTARRDYPGFIVNRILVPMI
ncbi:MAG: 3-hydroxybutyryl-CoA dehydrogenase, partial [Bdellovibrionales bacterium]|nr:3-hydroxybutyryl-CoA dehydrogenase [Bdellovibrionales bacterium]